MGQDSTFSDQSPYAYAYAERNREIQRCHYMRCIRAVVVYSGKTLAQAQKLLWNLQEDNPSPEVLKIFEKHYGSSYRALHNTIAKRRAELCGMIREANARARGLKLAPVEDINKLIDLLLDADRRKHYRARIDQFNKRKEAISFDQLEEEHQNWGRRKT